jgi:fibronectin type 3 domain-containing protein
MIDADLKKGEQYRYRLQAVQRGGIFSEYMTTDLLDLKPLPSAPVLTVKNSFGGFVTISIKNTITKTQEAEPVAVRIYRSEADVAGNGSLLATLPPEQVVTYRDQTVHYGNSYQYLATVVVQYKNGLLVEGEPAAPVKVVVDDAFE